MKDTKLVFFAFMVRSVLVYFMISLKKRVKVKK